MTPQPLHIFRKDILHLWPEASVVVALFIAFGIAAPSNWTNSPYAGVAQLVSLLLDLLMLLSWLVLISRLIHDEPLVGDRQFWTSRPYHWLSLLGAKLLFLVVFLYLPFFLMQVILLKHAGLYPMLALPALFHNLMLLTVAIVVPFAAIAAVTSTFARMLMSVVGGAVYFGIATLFVVWLVWGRMTPPVLDPILFTLLILLPAIALVYQYATRRTTISRIMLVATPLLLVLLTFITPFDALIRHGYPAASGASDPKLSDFPSEFRPKAAAPGDLAVSLGKVEIEVPFAVAGIDKDSAYLVKGASATITAPGITYTSPFLTEARQLTSAAPIAVVTVPLPLSVYNKIGTLPADVHLTLATDHLKLDPAATWKSSSSAPFDIPGHGHCTFSQDGHADLICHYAFKTPEALFATAPVSPGSCANPSAQQIPAQASVNSSGALSFDPIITVPVKFQTGDPETKHRYALCSGTPINFLEAKDTGKLRLDTDVKQLVLPNYAGRAQDQQQPGVPQ